MARAGFYNENEYRDYPFLTQTEPKAVLATLETVGSSSSSSSSASSASAQPLNDLPHETIVDAGFIMGVDSGFDVSADWVYLRRIRRMDPYLLFEFRTTASAAKAESLYFLRRIDDPEFTQQWSESLASTEPDPFPSSSSSSQADESSSLSGSSLSSFPFCEPETDDDQRLPCGGPGCDTPKWEGFLITGLFTDLLDQMADGEQLIFPAGLWIIEPARIQNLNNTYARSINLANTDRTRFSPPVECSSASLGVAPVYPNAVCMQGNLQFKEGYNCFIRQEDATSTLIIHGAVGGGEGQNCEEIPLFEGESAGADSPFLSGGPACGQVVKTINGKGNTRFRILGGPGVRVFDAPANPAALFIDADLHDFALCLQTDPQPGDPCYVSASSSMSSSSSSYSSSSSGGA